MPSQGGKRSLQEPVVKGLLEAVSLAERCEGAYQQIQALRAPTVAVFEATRQACVPMHACLCCQVGTANTQTSHSSSPAGAWSMSPLLVVVVA